MLLINASETTMVTIDNLITTAIKDATNKKQRVTTVTFLNKTRNDLIQLEIIEEIIKWFIKMGQL